MRQEACPSHEQLSEIVRGIADEEQTERIIHHADTCPSAPTGWTVYFAKATA